MAFSLTGETVAEVGTPQEPNCQSQTISALAHQFGNVHAAAAALGFSSCASPSKRVFTFLRVVRKGAEVVRVIGTRTFL